MAYDSAFINDVKASANENPDVIIGHYIKLKHNGKSLSACCPFHEEKTASFVVYTGTKPGYKCFGSCDGKEGGSGDSIGFIEKHCKVDFIGAIKAAASILGIPEKFAPMAQKSEAELKHAAHLREMKIALAEASNLYVSELAKSEEALSYLLNRGFNPSDLKAFQVGYAPRNFKFIYNQLKDKFSLSALTGSSLVSVDKESERVGDFQYNRIVFPIRDERSGDVLGFGGRTMQLTYPNPDATKEPIKIPKYKNTAATELFKKSELLFGLYESSKAPPPKHPRRYLVTEGYTDVIAAHRHRYTNTCAAMGTGFNTTLARKLFLRGDQIIFGQDGDTAGINAIYRAIKETAPLLTPEKTCGVMLLPTGEDIDSLLRKDPAKFASLYENPMSVSEFVADHVVKMFGTGDEARAAALQEVESLIDQIKHDTLKLSMRQAIFDRTGITIHSAKVIVVHNPEEQKHLAFASLDIRGQTMMSSLSEQVKAVAGMLIKHPRWAQLISIPSIENNPAISPVERSALSFSFKAVGNENIIQSPLGKYLIAHAPLDIDEQLNMVHSITNALVMSEDWNDNPDAVENDNEREISTLTLSH